MKAKFSIGDKVKIVGYGHPIFVSKKSGIDWRFPVISEDEYTIVYDMEPAIVGLEGVIDKISEGGSCPTYAVDGPSKHAWYNEDQLELINK